jgi:hypothetical protein
MPNESRVSLCFIQLPVGGMAIAGVDIISLKTQQKIWCNGNKLEGFDSRQ